MDDTIFQCHETLSPSVTTSVTEGKTSTRRVDRVYNVQHPPSNATAFDSRSTQKTSAQRSHHVRIRVQIETQTGLTERAANLGHVDVGIETVNRECLGKHDTVWHAERGLQSNL